MQRVSFCLGTLYLVLGISYLQAHSWIDCLDRNRDVVDSNSAKWVYGGNKGKGVCEGYGRGYPSRGDPNINTLYTYKILQADVVAGHQLCQFSKSNGGYSDWRKMQQAKPGDTIYFAYLPNGHIVKDKLGRTTTYGIYSSGSPDVELESTTQIDNSQYLIKLHSFDDNVCGETYEDLARTVRSDRSGDGHPCIGSFQIPKTYQKTGVYQFVWFWTFYNTEAGKVYSNGYYGAAYSTCFDIYITGDNGAQSNVEVKSTSTQTESSFRGISVSGDSTPSVAPLVSNVAATPVASSTSAVDQSNVNFASSNEKPQAIDVSLNALNVAMTYTNVGGYGTYDEVVNMHPGIFGETCPVDKCSKVPKKVEGSLAPFNEEVTVALRGPMILYSFDVFEPVNGQWDRVSSYDRQSPSTTKNINFMNNRGTWSNCGGNSQSFATSDGVGPSDTPTVFNGALGNDVAINLMTSREYEHGKSFFRGKGMHGWSGNNGSKIFVIKAQMPLGGTSAFGKGSDTPAIWMLNANVVRTAQYGCNCRGMGKNGGCGELDVAEVLANDPTKIISQLYSFQDSTGFTNYAPRPVTDPATFIVIFHSTSKSIKILKLDASITLGDAITENTVSSWMSEASKEQFLKN